MINNVCKTQKSQSSSKIHLLSVIEHLYKLTNIQHDLPEDSYLFMKILFPLPCHYDGVRAGNHIFLVVVHNGPFNSKQSEMKLKGALHCMSRKMI